MSDDAFGPLEEAFFAAGEAHHHSEEGSASDHEVYVDSEPHRPLSLRSLGLRLETALAAVGARFALLGRLLELRVVVAVSSCAEQALHATAFRIIGARPISTRVHTFIPRLTRNPVLVRASLVVLAFTAATFPAAAVLAATGAI
jgi:hypothetical protein